MKGRNIMPENQENMLHLPVRCTMRKTADGSFEMVDPVYADIPADVVARMLLTAFGIPIVPIKPPKEEYQ